MPFSGGSSFSLGGGHEDISIGASGNYVIPENRQVIGLSCVDATIKVQQKDIGGTWRDAESPAGDTLDSAANKLVCFLSPISDGTNLRLLNTIAGARDVRYWYLEYG